MITKLTNEQKNKIPDHVKKWVDIGLRTGNADREKFESAVRKCYKYANLKNDIQIIWVNSPIVGALSAPISANIICNFSAVDSAVRSAVGIAVRSAVRSAVRKNKMWWHYWFGGQFWSGWNSYIDYFISVCNLKLNNNMNERAIALIETSLYANYWWPNKYFCIACERPKKINVENNQLHCTNGIAIEYSDGWGLYMLHGVKVSKEIVMTPAEDIDCTIILTEKNAEVRREIIRKVGIDRVIKNLGAKTIEKNDVYELLNFDVIDGRYRPYLKMKNPSIDAIHVEGVHPDCKTIQQALSWRNFGRTDIDFVNPIILT